MPSWSPLLDVLLGLLLLTLGLLAPTLLVPAAVQMRPPMLHRLRWPLCCSLLMLSGCGTAPLRVETCPPVPADLLIRPAPPVLLQPRSSWQTSGTTTPPTLPDAASPRLGTTH